MASTDLLLSSPTAGDRQKGTISVWVKRTAIETNGYLYSTWNTSVGGYSSGLFQFTGNTDQLVFTNYQADGGTHTELKTNRQFRDLNCWYHICINWNTTLATSSDRYKMFINGVRETSFATAIYPSQNENLFFDIGGANNPIRIGSVQGTSAYLDAVLSHYHKVDGTAYDASTFGETDSTTGEWKIKTSPSLTYGSGSGNFFIFKDGTNLSGSTVQDQSGEGNDLTVDGGTLTKTEDSPSNVFCTMNSLDNQNQASSFTMGNNKIEWNTNNKTNFATFAVNKGKWYWEMKYANNSGGTDAMTGVCREVSRDGSDWVGHDSHGWSYYASNGNKYTGGSGSSYGNSWTTNNIIGVAFDADTRTLWFSKDGVWQNSATISEIAAGTTTNSAFTNFGTAGEFFFPATSGYDGNKIEFNFGNGYFSTTQITSAGSNASNIGLFEYDVPNNFTALSTKGLNE